MSDPTPYERLGVTEDASFEEVRDARDRLIGELEGDELQQELVEAAYDAILMDRLRARQEGKIKVPDRIRFPERLSANLPSIIQPSPVKRTPNWLANLVDNPSRKEILTSLAVFAGLGAIGFLVPTAAATWLAIALLASIYLLNRKENRFGRSILLALAGLALAVLLGLAFNRLPTLATPEFPSPLLMAIMMVVMWLVSCFLR